MMAAGWACKFASITANWVKSEGVKIFDHPNWALHHTLKQFLIASSHLNCCWL